MSSHPDFEVRIVATREPEASLWSFYLVNTGESAIEEAELTHVKYEFGDQYMGPGETPNVKVVDLAPGTRAHVWNDNGASEMRTDLWVRFKHRGTETWCYFEFPKLYRQTGTTLEAGPWRADGPPRT